MFLKNLFISVEKSEFQTALVLLALLVLHNFIFQTPVINILIEHHI